MARPAATYGLALILAVGTTAVSLGQGSPDTQAELDGRLAKAADHLSKGQFPQVIEILSPLRRSSNLSDRQRARLLHMLAHAQADTGAYDERFAPRTKGSQ